MIVACDLAPGNVHDLQMAEEVSEGATGTLLGDRNYWSPTMREQLSQHGLDLQAPFKLKTYDPAPWPRWLPQIRRRIETVFGQLAERLKAKRVWARDVWHLTSRWYRRLCAHTLGVVLCQAEGRPPLRFSEVIADGNPHIGLARPTPLPQRGAWPRRGCGHPACGIASWCTSAQCGR